jgi:hypothetical protein
MPNKQSNTRAFPVEVYFLKGGKTVAKETLFFVVKPTVGEILEVMPGINNALETQRFWVTELIQHAAAKDKSKALLKIKVSPSPRSQKSKPIGGDEAGSKA